MNHEIIEKAQKLDASGKAEEAVKLLIPLVNKGDLIAKSNLGFIYCYSFYENGDFIKIKEGEVLLNEACEAGEPSACHNLGTLWSAEIPSIGHDLRKAAQYYLKARELGGPVATKDFYDRWEKILND